MKNKKIIIFSLLLLLFSLPVYADTCTVTDKMNLKKLAGFIDITYYPYDEGNDVRFNLIVTNASDFMFASDKNDVYDSMNKNGENDEIRISNLIPGESYMFHFYAKDTNCFGTEIYNKKITLPNYNKFYNDAVCNGKEEFYLCNKWKEHNLSYDEFVKKVNEYQKSETNVIQVQEETVKGFWDILLEVYLKYYWAILIPIIVILISFIIYLKKKDDLIK